MFILLLNKYAVEFLMKEMHTKDSIMQKNWLNPPNDSRNIEKNGFG